MYSNIYLYKTGKFRGILDRIRMLKYSRNMMIDVLLHYFVCAWKTSGQPIVCLLNFVCMAGCISFQNLKVAKSIEIDTN